MEGAGVSRTSEVRAWLVAFSIALVPFGVLCALQAFACDDAYISFRYARHLVEGQGLVFNPGELPPVEGYSNFLWVLWIAAFLRAGVDPVLAANATSIVAAVALIGLVTRVAQKRLELDPVGLAATALFAGLLPPITLWSTGGLETMPFALCAFGSYAALAFDRERPRALVAGACAIATALLRADGALWAALAIVVAAIDTAKRGSWKTARAWRPWIIVLACLAAATAAHVAWRASYYGDWLPNTARVKAGFDFARIGRGFDYAVAQMLAMPACALVPLAVVFMRGRPAPRMAFAALAFVLGAVLYAIEVGGDFMPMGRFVVAAMPFEVLLFAIAYKRISSSRPRALAFALVVLALTPLPSLGVDVVPRSLRERFHFRLNDARSVSESEMAREMKERAQQWAVLGRALALHARPNESIVLGNIGAIGYFTELRIHDLFGLVSPEILGADLPLGPASPGHDRAVTPEFFFPRKPTYLNAFLARQGSPIGALPPAWARLVSSGRVRVESHPLDPAAGFPPGLELRVLRFVWDA
jgi:hypothetical protein